MKITFDAKNIGLAFAEASDEEQAAFFNEFGRAMCMAIRDTNKRDMQLCYAADKLDENGKWLVKELAAAFHHKLQRLTTKSENRTQQKP